MCLALQFPFSLRIFSCSGILSGMWKPQSTFAAFRLRDLSCKSEDMFSIRPTLSGLCDAPGMQHSPIWVNCCLGLNECMVVS